MFEYTYNNHFKFGYNDGSYFTKRKTKDQKFIAQYGRASLKNIDWRESNIVAAKKIYESSKGKDIIVLFSGGIDSEICVRSFLDADVPFKVLIGKYKNNSNLHDIQYAFEFCRISNLSPLIVELDIEKFWNSNELYKITDICNCVSPQLAACLWLADQVNGIPVIAQGEPYLKKLIPKDYVPGVSPYSDSSWFYIESDRLCSLFRYFIELKKEAIPAFFQYLPEQMYTLLSQSKVIKDLVENKLIGKLGTRSSKFAIYKEYYPDLVMRPKFHGFENYELIHSELRSQLANRYPLQDTDYEIEYYKMLELLGSVENKSKF